MISIATSYYILVSFAFGYFLSLYPGKSSKKHGQSFAKDAINSPVRSAERHYCDISKRSAQVLPFSNLIGDRQIRCSYPNFSIACHQPLSMASGDETIMLLLSCL